MEANDIQIGGKHYKRKFQHWDFVCDTGLHYLLGCATKYVSRWRDKNGIEDLKKTAHYLHKAEEKGIEPPSTQEMDNLSKEFAEQLDKPMDREIFLHICQGNYAVAQTLIGELIIGHTCVDKE